MTLEAIFSEDETLVGELASIEEPLTGYLSDIVGEIVCELGTGAYSNYEGAYDVVPQIYNDVILQTKGMLMINNVTVYEIPITSTSNPHGGKTVLIG